MRAGVVIKKLFFLAVFLFISAVSVAYYFGVVPTSVGIHPKYYIASSIAMDGYDLTIYHSKKKANKGDVRFNFKYDDTNWFFTNTRNQKLFAARPQKYIPKFGGYCTYTISKGYTYPPDMNIWHLDKKGNLYFFKDKESRKEALDDWANVIKEANKHWK
jgi:hypothetical protein